MPTDVHAGQLFAEEPVERHPENAALIDDGEFVPVLRRPRLVVNGRSVVPRIEAGCVAQHLESVQEAMLAVTDVAQMIAEELPRVVARHPIGRKP